MYDMKVKTPPLANKRRSWTGRLKDRFKSSAGGGSGHGGMAGSSGSESPVPVDDWTSAWVTHPHLQEGHHAPSVPSLQGSVFVAANFVYDYRQKYGLDPASGWMAAPTVGSLAMRRTADWTATRGPYPVRTSPVFRTVDPPIDVSRLVKATNSAPVENYSSYEFKAADVNQNIRQMRENKQHKVSVGQVVPPLPTSPPPRLCLFDDGEDEDVDGDDDSNQDSKVDDSDADSSNDDTHPQTTVAVDRPGLIVSGQRICILTGQDSPSAIQAEKVSLRVEFQRCSQLRRSLSDRARPKMAAPAYFQDTTRLTQKTRSRGSLHDLFGLPPPEPLHITIPVTEKDAPSATPLTTRETPISRRKTIVRPTEPPPPPPLPPAPIECRIEVRSAGVEEHVDTPPVAPPRRVYRHSKADNGSLTRASSVKSGSDSTASVPATPTPIATLDLSPGVTSWAGRPLSGQVNQTHVGIYNVSYNYWF